MITLVIPVYNEESNVGELIKEIRRCMKDSLEAYEFLFVDDGSTDRTLEILRSVDRQEHVHTLSLSRRFGHQVALKAGLDHAEGDAVITLDGDLQHPPSLLVPMIQKWREGFHIVCAIRKKTKNVGFFKQFFSNGFYFLIEALSDVSVPRGSADFRLLDKQVVLAVRQFSETHLFLRGLVNLVGFDVFYMPYEADPRFAGEPKYKLKHMITLALDGVMGFSVKPLRWAGLVGLGVTLMSSGYALYAMWEAVFKKSAISGWASLLVTVLFLGGVQLLGMGLMGEYMGKMFIEVKKRPVYFVREKR